MTSNQPVGKTPNGGSLVKGILPQIPLIQELGIIVICPELWIFEKKL